MIAVAGPNRNHARTNSKPFAQCVRCSGTHSVGRNSTCLHHCFCRNRTFFRVFPSWRFASGHGGVFAAAGTLKIGSLALFVTLCAIAGDQLGYWIGRRAGQALYRRKDSTFFKRRHLEQTHEFYEKYGGKTVILARFIPIVRTFCPPVAGAAQMRYPCYLAYDLLSGCSWGAGLVLAGYFLGSMVPNIGQRIHRVIAVVIVLSLLPALIGAVRSRRQISKPGALPVDGSTEQ